MSPANSNNKIAIQLRLQALLGREPVRALMAALNLHGEEARIVGGAIRDTLMGRQADDIDIATTILPETVMRLAKLKGWKAIPTGIEHGTVTIVIGSASHEVTTLRRDVETDGRRAVVTFTRDFKDDAFRRDFTINALSLSQDGVVHDYATGIDDAKSGIIRFMGQPETRIREDYLRILRYFRFQASHGSDGRYQDTIDYQSCGALKSGLTQISRERVRQEVLKLLAAKGCVVAVKAMAKIGLWEILLSDVGINPSILEQLLALERASGKTADVTVRLAALCQPESNPAKLKSLLALSGDETKHMMEAEALARHITEPRLDHNILKKLAFLGGKTGLTNALLLKHARMSVRPEITSRELEGLELIFATLPTNPFTSADVAARGVAPGPRMGRVLKIALDTWLEAGLPDDTNVQAKMLDDAVTSLIQKEPIDSVATEAQSGGLKPVD